MPNDHSVVCCLYRIVRRNEKDLLGSTQPYIYFIYTDGMHDLCLYRSTISIVFGLRLIQTLLFDSLISQL